MKEFACKKVASPQASILLKLELLQKYFSGKSLQTTFLRNVFYTEAEILKQLEKDVDPDADVEKNENEINVSGEANIVEEVMDRIIPESSINNITQRDEESSDKIEDGY